MAGGWDKKRDEKFVTRLDLTRARFKSTQLNSARAARRFVCKPKIQNLGKFWGVLQWKMLAYFMDT
jgi:hypothetical protein